MGEALGGALLGEPQVRVKGCHAAGFVGGLSRGGPRDSAGRSSTLAEGRLLIVEDENIVAKDLRVTVERLGYDVVDTVATGVDAILRAEATHPDLVLMDIALRGEVDGIQAAGEIRDRWDVPVIYLTAHADEGTLQRAKVTEPFGYVLKPFQERELHTAIVMALYKHRMDRELRNSRQWLDTTLRSIGDAVIATDQQGRVLLMNSTAESLTGWSEAHAQGQPLAGIFRIFNEYTDRPAENPVDRVLREGVVVGLANHTVLLGRTGVERAIDDSAAPIRSLDGEMLGVVLVFRDISERRRLEATLAEHARRLEEAHRRKDEFLAMLAHELRNPLMPLSLGLELLADTDQSRDLVRTMKAQVQHLVRLVDDLLDVSRITRGQIELRKQEVALTTVLERAVEMARPLLDDGPHELSVRTPDEPIVLDADPVRLTQAIANLLNNAAKYSPPNSPIRLVAERAGKTVVIRVQDQGVGIDPEWLPRVFDVFVQADQSLGRKHGGLGIGLTLVQTLVRLHGGEVRAASEGRGRGSEFVVTLPIRAGQPPGETDVEQGPRSQG